MRRLLAEIAALVEKTATEVRIADVVLIGDPVMGFRLRTVVDRDEGAVDSVWLYTTDLAGEPKALLRFNHTDKVLVIES